MLVSFLMANCLHHRQIDKDCEFLEQERIMDYSLLVGIHFREASVTGELIPSGARTPIGSPLLSNPKTFFLFPMKHL